MFAWLHPGPKLPTLIHQAFSADLLAAYRLEGDDGAWLVAAKSGLVRVASDGAKTPLCAWDEVERAAWDGQERKFTINPINACPRMSNRRKGDFSLKFRANLLVWSGPH